MEDVLREKMTRNDVKLKRRSNIKRCMPFDPLMRENIDVKRRKRSK